MAGAAVGIRPYVAGDVCNRADNAAVPGTASSGQAWTVSAGTVGVLANALYAPAAANSRATINSGIADGEFGLTSLALPAAAAEVWLVFRYQDSTNYWRFGKHSTGSTNWRLQSVIAGSTADLFSLTGKAALAGDRLKVVCNGNTIDCYLNGVLLGSASSSSFATATSFGIQTAATSPRFGMIYAKRLPS